MLKIQIIALPKPNKKISGPGIDNIEPSTTPREIIASIAAAYPELNIKADKADLIIDKTASIPRLAVNDPVNEYFNGHTGDIYRIVDDSSTRFRMVAGTAVRNKTKTSPFHDVTDTMYYSAYNTVLDMLKDRRHGETDDEIDSLLIKTEDMTQLFAEGQMSPLNIMGVPNRRGRYMYVFFLSKDDETMVSRKRSAGAKGPIKALITPLIKKVVDDYNQKTGDKLVVPTEDRGPTVQNFLDKIEMIIVCNNQHNDNLVKHELPIQVFSVQQLVFNVTKHMDQPSFYILDPTDDRDEILDVLSLNGLVLEKDKSIADFNIKDGTKLILL